MPLMPGSGSEFANFGDRDVLMGLTTDEAWLELTDQDLEVSLACCQVSKIRVSPLFKINVPLFLHTERTERDSSRPDSAYLRAKHVPLPPARDLLDAEERVHGLGARRAKSHSHLRGTARFARRWPSCGSFASVGFAPLRKRWQRLPFTFPAGRQSQFARRGAALFPWRTFDASRRELHRGRRELIQAARALSCQFRPTRVSLSTDCRWICGSVNMGL